MNRFENDLTVFNHEIKFVRDIKLIEDGLGKTNPA